MPQVTQQLKKQRRGDKKSVRFDNAVTMVCTIHLLDYTFGEYSASFYGRNEIDSFKNEAKQTARMMDMVATKDDNDDDEDLIIFDEEEYCTRGVESRTKTGSKVRRWNRKVAMNAVLGGQNRLLLSQQQNNKGGRKLLMDDATSTALASIYGRMSYASVTSAQMLGQSDALIWTEVDQKLIDLIRTVVEYEKENRKSSTTTTTTTRKSNNNVVPKIKGHHHHRSKIMRDGLCPSAA